VILGPLFRGKEHKRGRATGFRRGETGERNGEAVRRRNKEKTRITETGKERRP